MRIAQLSDTHLTASETKHAWGSPVWPSFRRALEMVAAEGEVDRIVVTGDLANQRRRATYARLRDALGERLGRALLIPGNHDSRRRFSGVFGDRLVAGRRTANFVDHACGIRLIGLDSLRGFYRVSGKLGREQIAWLAGLLATAEPTLLFVHHPVVRVGCWWLDKDILRDRERLAGVMRGSCVKALFFGHVHQEHSAEFAGIPVHATPSTAYQFPPGAIRPGATMRGEAAFRIIDVDPEFRIATRVVRSSSGDPS